jgi:7,8-dihydropterin-6-yl-methyl-4-(beta-D-ribofuranosyl)aminobenzene 5'-phosphate synthase
MKIVTLLENTTCRDELQYEHGLSLYIEACGKKILFDAGASGVFADNAAALGIDLSQVDIAILSHAHSDHCGGFLSFLEYNDKAPILARPETRGSYHNASGNSIGMDPGLRYSKRICCTEDTQPIAKGLTLFAAKDMEMIEPIDSAGLSYCPRDTLTLLPDDFQHEQYLLIEEAGKRVLISGCSHKGILNIANHFKPQVLIGGFHYMRVDPTNPRLESAAHSLLQHPTVYYTGHCTGAEQFDAMKKIMADRLQPLSTGTIIEL